MVILVDYQNSGEKEDARKIIDKICESYKCEFFDFEERISYGDASIPSLEFTMLKNALDTDIPAIESDVVIDNVVLQTIVGNFDDFQTDFIANMLQSLGTVLVVLHKDEDKNDVVVSDDKTSFSFCMDREFFVDLKKKLDKRMAYVKNGPFYKLLSGLKAYGFYIGTCDLNNPPTKAIVLPGGAGHKITYDEYANWILATKPLYEIEREKLTSLEGDDENFVFVRQHHPIELMAKKIVKEKK